MCTLRHLLRTLLLVAVPAHQLAAQQIGGTVVDIVTGEPVPAVTVELFDPASTVVASVVADDAGEFVISIPAPGAYRIGTRHAGYQDARSASLELEARDTLTVQFRIAPEVVVLNPLTVVTSSRRQPGPLSGFDERARRGAGGLFIPREEVERRRPLRISDLLAGSPGVQVVARAGLGNTILLRGCEPSVFIDSIRIHGGASAIDELVSPIEIAAVEVYRGPSEVPVEFSGPEAACGAIVIWTN